jgi:hypothetical protein
MNILGEGFHKNIINQIDQRQKVYGSGYTEIPRTSEEIVYLNANTAWCKLMSSTNIKDISVLNNPTITDLGLTGNELAKRFVLFNGTSLYDNKVMSLRGGISDTGNALGIDSNSVSSAYGIGGTEFGINPMPGIQSVSVSHENRGSLRQASIKLKAWNRAQFEIIDVLYLRLGYSVLLEWGNSMYFDDKGVLQTNMNNTLDSIFLEGESNYNSILNKINSKRIETFGNYDAMFAKVKNFHWSFQKDGSYDITVDLISSGDIIESLKANAIIEDMASTDSEAKTEDATEKPINDNQIIDFYAKKSSLGQFFYFLKYQLDSGEYKKDGTKRRVTFSFSDLPNNAAEDQNKDIKLRNTLNDVEVYATLGLAKLIGIAWNWAFDTDYFVNKPPLPTDIAPEMFKVYGKQGEEIKEIKVVDAIQIPWDDKEGNDETYYVRLGTLLAYMQHYLIPKCISSNGNASNASPLINVDYDQDTNLMYANKWQVGVDPRICTVGRTIKISTGIVGTFFESWGDYDFSTDCSPFINPYFTISTGEKDEDGNDLITEYGNIMNIYVNMAFILNKIDELKDDKNKVSLFDILKGICDGINEGLSGINALEPIIDENSNTIRIIDANPLPNKDEILKKVNELSKDFNLSISTELASFDLYGYTTDKDGVGKSSFIRDFDFTTEITPEYSTMITVGASANGSVVGANSTALSKLNIGLEDRYKTEILDAYDIKNKAAEIGSLAASASTELNILKKRYKNTIEEYFDWLEELSDEVSEPTLNVNDVDSYKTTLVNIVQVEEQVRNQKYVLNTLKEGKDPNDPKNQVMAPGTGFIPFNLSITMDGLSGMKIYSKFTIDTRYLPSNYEKTVEFLIKNISHEIQDSRWTTKLESFCISKGKFADSSPQSTSTTGDGNTNNNTNTNTNTNNTSCGTPFTTQVPLSFTNKTNPKYINAFNKAIYNTFRGGTGESGMCSKYTYSTAAAFINVLKGRAPGSQFLSGKGNAKDISVRNFLTSIGYNVVKAGENLNKNDVQKLLNSTTYNIGDIVIYWAKDGNQSDSQVRYGHIEIYSGKVWNPYPYKKQQNNFVSSVPDNYTNNPFVYGRKSNQCWTAYVCRIPNI